MDKKANGSKKCMVKGKRKSKDYKECLKKNKTILKSQKVSGVRHTMYSRKKVNKTALSANDIRSNTNACYGVILYPYGIDPWRTCKAKLMKHSKTKLNIVINFDQVTGKNTQRHSPRLPQISNHPYRSLIEGASGSVKTNILLNLIGHQPDTDKIYLYAKDLYKYQYQYLINKREYVGLKHFKNPKTFTE